MALHLHSAKPPTFEDLPTLTFSNPNDLLYLDFKRVYHTNSFKKTDTLIIRSLRNPTLKKTVDSLKESVFEHIPHFHYIGFDGRYAGHYGISAKSHEIFFRALQGLQVNGSSVCIERRSLQKVLCLLQQCRYITIEEAQRISSTAQTSTTFDQIKGDAITTKNPKMALSIAYYYQSKPGNFHDVEALEWLLRARKYSKNQPLHELLDLDEFLLNITRFSSTILSSTITELDEPIARSSSTKEFYFDLHTFTGDAIKRAEQILEKTQSIERAVFAPPWTKVKIIQPEVVDFIATVMKTNSSITDLDLSETQIGDKGIISIIEAMEKNPNLKVKTLLLFACCISDSGANKIIELLKKREELSWVHIDKNPNISPSLQDEIRAIVQKRNP